MPACYWKDSKVIVFGGENDDEGRYCSTVAVITLRDLDSDSIFFTTNSSSITDPSAYWERMETPTELVRSAHSAHIYRDKMYVFGGFNDKEETKDDV